MAGDSAKAARTAAPGGQDTVQYTLYNVMGQASQQSGAYFVAAYTGAGGVAAAFSIPDSTQTVSSAFYDGLGRVLAVEDQLGETSTEAYSIVCNAPGTNDTGCYEQTLAVDANHHQTGTLADGFGRQIYAQRYTGSGAPYALYATEVTTYDTSGRVVQQTHANGSQTTYSYNADGTLASSSDPDQGTMAYIYDANDNQTEQVDARGAAGTTYTGYDGLNRPVWRNTTNSASGAYVTYSYDAGMAGSFGTGRLTAEVFRGSGSGTGGTGATAFSGAYTYRYDALGRTTRTDQTMGGAGVCPSGWTCQDIGYSAPAGGQNAAGDGLWTLQASGGDVYGTSDGLHLVSQPLSGDGAITAHFDSQTVTGTYTKMGVMLRGSTAANAAEYNVQVDANGLYYVAVRSSSGGSTTNLAQGNLTGPVWLKVARSGSSYSAYTSTDGQHWTYVANSTITLSLGASVLAGVFASANNASAVSLATLDSVSVTTGGTGACPSGWSCEDIGYTSPAGGQTAFGDGLWTLQASGGDVYGTSDGLHLVSQPLSGDGGISAHFDSQTATGTYAKMGVMLRGSDAPNAAEYNLQVDANGQFYVAYRATDGGSTSNLTQGTLTGPVWLKVARSGSSYTAYTSSDGTTWTAVPNSTITLNLGASVLAGVFACANTTSTTTTATLDGVNPQWADPSSLTTATPSPPSGVSSYVTTQSYDDAGAPTNTVYPDGEMVATSYTPQEWLAGLSTTQGGTATTLLSNVSYSGAGGAAQEMTGATLANGVYTEALSYDAMARPTESSITRLSDGALLFDSKRAYDAVGNVANVWTTLPTGTDYQAFCYDEQNRLVWASSQSGTVPCDGDPTWTAGTLSGATYTKTYSYDTLNRLTSGPGGSYTYGDSAHLDAATAITGSSSGYTASYDAAGDMACRAPTSATTCTGGSPTGAQMSYDNERRLASWQNAPGNTPTSSTSNLYDGEGHRVEQQVTNGAATTTVTYVGAIEELSTTAGVTTTTTSYYAGGQRIAQAVNGAFGYLGSDGLGSAEVALDGSGNPQASALYDPYGNVRYTSGTMPGSYGYTGQRADAATGLDDFNARYYDPTLGQFTSADTVGDGLNRYAYVADDPETGTDPSGHCWLVCAVIAAVATAVVATAVDAVVQQVTTGQVDWGTALKTGATAGLMVGAAIALGPAAAAVEGTIAGGLGGGAVASVAAAAAVGAGEGAAFQVGDNVVNGRDWRAGVGQAALIGGVSAGVLSGAGELLGSAGDDAGAFCGLSFAPETPVATPNGGEQAISSLHVGDAVEAYDPTTGTTSAQHVQQLFVNHDTDLLDVTLRTSVPHAKRAAPPANPSMSGHVQQNLPAQQHGQQSASHDTSTTQATETVHTTANHPWLTADHGWEQAGVLRVGEPVVTADGDAAVVVALRVVAGTAAMWDLTVSNVHDFAVGSGEYIVHNCDGEIDPNEVRFTQNSAAQRFRNGRSVFGTIDDLRSGALSPDDVDPIRIFRKESWMDNLNAGRGSGSNLEDGQLYSLDNRRLYAFQQAGMTRIRFVWATTDEIVGNVDHFTTENWGTSIRIRGIN